LDIHVDTTREWLEADGLGGFAMGTASGLRTRRYHGLLNVATRPPAGRIMLVKGYDAWLDSVLGRLYLSSQVFAPETVHPSGTKHLAGFDHLPWPTWVHAFDDGTRVSTEIMVPRGHGAVLMRWRLLDKGVANKLNVRLFMSALSMHELQREQEGLRFDMQQDGDKLRWVPEGDAPTTVAWTNAEYKHEPHWYSNFLYLEERSRGLDCEEDLLSTGILSWDLRQGDALLLLGAPPYDSDLLETDVSLEDCASSICDLEQLRRHALGAMDRAAESYLVDRGEHKTVIAGYPWLVEHGRDTFVALRGLCLTRDRLDPAGAVLLNWASALVGGMLPSRYAGKGTTPEYSSVDASLWFAIAVADYTAALADADKPLTDEVTTRLRQVVEEVLDLYTAGTKYGIKVDEDGLLAAGEPEVQLTWMDAKVGNWAVTPRIGKPIEVQCLWLNALAFAAGFEPRFTKLYQRGIEAFRRRFFDAVLGYAYDVVDVDHVRGEVDTRMRPSQILAVGGLPLTLLEEEPARRVVDAVEQKLWTPMGLRSLDPEAPEYEPHHVGDILERDGSYHQGTVWPWLAGPFIDAWLRVRGNTEAARAEARERFLPAMRAHLSEAGLGHVSEVADGDPPHPARGGPFQAWSVGEWLRVEKLLGCTLDADEDSVGGKPTPTL